MSFAAFDIMFFLVFALVFCVIAVTLLRGLREWNQNNHAPRLTVSAAIVAKRTNISRHRHGNANGVGHHTSTSTTYYVTFQVESGDRMELSMAGRQYGLLIEGDRGQLTFQGTRFLDFQRI